MLNYQMLFLHSFAITLMLVESTVKLYDFMVLNIFLYSAFRNE